MTRSIERDVDIANQRATPPISGTMHGRPRHGQMPIWEVGVGQLPVSGAWTRWRSVLLYPRPTLQAGYGSGHIRSLAARWQGQVYGSRMEPPTLIA